MRNDVLTEEKTDSEMVALNLANDQTDEQPPQRGRSAKSSGESFSRATLLSINGLRWIADASWLKPEFQTYLAEPERLTKPPATYLKPPIPNSGSRIFRLEVNSIFPAPLVIKRYEDSEFSQKLKILVKGPRSKRSFHWATFLGNIGIPCVTPIAAGYCKSKPWQSYFITLQVTPSVTLLDFAQTNNDTRQRRRFIRALAQALAKLHDASVSYGDAHLANFLVQQRENDFPALVLVDLDGLRRFPWISLARAARDLRRLIRYTPTSPREQLRFLAEYSRARKQPIDTHKLLSCLRAS